MSDTTWWTYVERLIGTDTAQDAARRAGFDKSAFTRWKKGAKADPEFAVKLARAYGANVLEALVAAGLITDAEAALREVNPSKRDMLRDLADVELAEEQRRRAEHTIIRIDAGMTKSDVEEQMARAVQMGLLSVEEQTPVEEQAMVLALQLSKPEGLQEEYGLAARRTGQRKGSDPAGLDDGEE
ncbi:hypothetical protein TPB0596_11880 [Tsukamurella pulmonis]|uniref:hypothetical protein n=1 Tax=Tsukamurella pulmonis TaxID=47312 RepID=UPI001EDD1A17|nr:hypothetical protein [Tsukamurella pulmonis]BDD81425.1 hypothetical protein TPB0596_11880 [Tsukamurella pulmonis]